MTEPVEVTAEVIEDSAIVRVDFTPATIKVDYDSVLAKVQNMIEPYQGLTEEQWLAVDMKECKTSRAHMNRIKKEINDSKKLIEKTYTKPLKEFQEFCKTLGAMVDECSANVDSAIKLRENKDKQAKYQQLNDHFYEYCFDNGFRALTESVNFDAILVNQWLNKTFSLDKAKNEIEARVKEIMHSWQTLSNHELFDRDGAMIEFFNTLSVTKALEYDAKRKADQERLDAMQQEKEQVQQYREPEPVTTVPEPDPVPLDVYEPAQPQPFYGDVEPVFTWELTLDCTRTQLYQLRDIMLQMGLDPHARKVVM